MDNSKYVDNSQLSMGRQDSVAVDVQMIGNPTGQLTCHGPARLKCYNFEQVFQDY